VTIGQNAYFEGLYLSSSTIATAMTNLVPAVTFVLATVIG
ncbi:WAT1-related protein, partial [Parasponia andersonii]